MSTRTEALVRRKYNSPALLCAGGFRLPQSEQSVQVAPALFQRLIGVGDGFSGVSENAAFFDRA